MTLVSADKMALLLTVGDTPLLGLTVKIRRSLAAKVTPVSGILLRWQVLCNNCCVVPCHLEDRSIVMAGNA